MGLGLTETAKWIKARLSAGQFRLSIHAVERAEQRVVTERDIRRCGMTAEIVKYQADKGTWRIEGYDCDGENLTVICAVHEMLLVITVF